MPRMVIAEVASGVSRGSIHGRSEYTIPRSIVRRVLNIARSVGADVATLKTKYSAPSTNSISTALTGVQTWPDLITQPPAATAESAKVVVNAAQINALFSAFTQLAKAAFSFYADTLEYCKSQDSTVVEMPITTSPVQALASVTSHSPAQMQILAAHALNRSVLELVISINSTKCISLVASPAPIAAAAAATTTAVARMPVAPATARRHNGTAVAAAPIEPRPAAIEPPEAFLARARTLATTDHKRSQLDNLARAARAGHEMARLRIKAEVCEEPLTRMEFDAAIAIIGTIPMDSATVYCALGALVYNGQDNPLPMTVAQLRTLVTFINEQRFPTTNHMESYALMAIANQSPISDETFDILNSIEYGAIERFGSVISSIKEALIGQCFESDQSIRCPGLPR